jgi:LSD1 subclass zinc finger protein
MYLIVVCSGCGRLLVTNRGAKSRSCPYCGVRVKLAKAKLVGSAKTAREASELAQRLKQRRHEEKSSTGFSH